MRKLSKYAFLIKHTSFNAQIHHAELKSDEFHSIILGVKDVEEAIATIQELINGGIELVELCGGFSEEDELQIKGQIHPLIPVGRADLKRKDIELLTKNLDKKM